MGTGAGAAPLLDHFNEPMTITIFGIVIDEFGRTIRGVSVTLLSGDAVIVATLTKEFGEFEVVKTSVKVGFYTMRVIAPDYKTGEEKLTLAWDLNNSSFEIVLRLESISKPSIPDLTLPELEYPYFPMDSEKPKELEEKAQYEHLRVFFATDRSQNLLVDDPKDYFGDNRNSENKIFFGSCEVTIPYQRGIGDTPRPSIFKLQFKEDPNKHIVIKSCTKLGEQDFFAEVASHAETSSDKSALLFVHGYCVTFAEAIYRTAQIARDLQFEGAPVCYSWPSKGRFLGYSADEESIEWTEEHLLYVLRAILNVAAVKTVHVIAHIMGNRAVLNSLQALTFQSPTGKEQFKQVVFAAPDVDQGIFLQRLDKLKGTANRLTLYAASNDRPLKWSKFFHSFARAGEGGENLLLHPILDSIDASLVTDDVLKHSYYGSTRTVLSDIYELFRHGVPPPRFGIEGPLNQGKGPYFEFRP